MGSLSLTLIIYTVKCISILVLVIAVPYLIYLKNNKKAKRFLEWLIENTFFNQIIGILIESYFEFLTAAYLHLTFSGDLVTRGYVPRSLETDILKVNLGEKIN